MTKKINVEVAFALPDRQLIVSLSVDEGCTLFEAAQLAKVSKLDKEFPGIDLESMPMGIFGKAERKPKERQLLAGDRVEIYRPLLVDPKEVRKKRAAKAAEEKLKQKQQDDTKE